MKILVINLAKDVNRRKSISGQLDNLGLEYDIVPGVFGAGLAPEDRLKHYDDKKAKWRLSRSLVPAEIGCALSHLKVYREIDTNGIECALVLEDDVVISTDLELFLSDCEAALDPTSPEVWLLSPARARQSASGRRLLRSKRKVLPLESGMYTSSYIVTSIAAKALLAELYPVCDVADCWNRLQRYGVVDVFVTMPPLTEQNQAEFGSSTTAGLTRYAGDRLTWLAYKARRTRAVIWESFYAPYRRLTRRYRPVRVGVPNY